MSNFKIGQHYDPAFKEMSLKEIKDNLEAVCFGLEERPYTKNLTPEELLKRKEDYSQVGLVLSEIETAQKEAMDRFKEQSKEPKARSKELLDSIKFKSEQKYGTLSLVDDQENGMMYYFDQEGICVDARPLDVKERQLKIKKVVNDE